MMSSSESSDDYSPDSSRFGDCVVTFDELKKEADKTNAINRDEIVTKADLRCSFQNSLSSKAYFVKILEDLIERNETVFRNNTKSVTQPQYITLFEDSEPITDIEETKINAKRVIPKNIISESQLDDQIHEAVLGVADVLGYDPFIKKMHKP